MSLQLYKQYHHVAGATVGLIFELQTRNDTLVATPNISLLNNLICPTSLRHDIATIHLDSLQDLS